MLGSDCMYRPVQDQDGSQASIAQESCVVPEPVWRFRRKRKKNFAPDGTQTLDKSASSIVTVLTELLVVMFNMLQKLLGVLNGSAELLYLSDWTTDCYGV
jgi:hypothetical protein